LTIIFVHDVVKPSTRTVGKPLEASGSKHSARYARRLLHLQTPINHTIFKSKRLEYASIFNRFAGSNARQSQQFGDEEQR
jgi:hypothetical protein